MFTGLITHIGRVKSILRKEQGLGLSVKCPDGFLDDVEIGDSINVSGSCLTVTEIKETIFKVDVSPETLSKTTILKWQEGREVNLEKSLSASGRLGGHFVMGHVDGVARLREIKNAGTGRVYTFDGARALLQMIVPKGSVSIDGVSLTPASRDDSRFSIAVIPHTLERTTLNSISIGDEVNLEIDIFARYIFEFLKLQKSGNLEGNLDIETLREEGF